MNINASRFGLAAALGFALAWVICSLFVLSMPLSMMRMSGFMFHADLGQTAWNLSWFGFVCGLLAWPIIAGAMAWGIAVIYNRLIS